MQHCAGLIISYPSKFLTSIQSVICACIQIILWTVSIYCAIICDKISVLMYSYKLRLINKKHQMYGHLHGVLLKKSVFMRKHLNSKKNFWWHCDHFVCGNTTRTTTTTRNMRNTLSVIMSGKCDGIHRMAKILGEHVT